MEQVELYTAPKCYCLEHMHDLRYHLNVYGQQRMLLSLLSTHSPPPCLVAEAEKLWTMLPVGMEANCLKEGLYILSSSHSILPLPGDRMISNMNESVSILQSKSNQKQNNKKEGVLDANRWRNVKTNKM